MRPDPVQFAESTQAVLLVKGVEPVVTEEHEVELLRVKRAQIATPAPEAKRASGKREANRAMQQSTMGCA